MKKSRQIQYIGISSFFLFFFSTMFIFEFIEWEPVVETVVQIVLSSILLGLVVFVLIKSNLKAAISLFIGIFAVLLIVIFLVRHEYRRNFEGSWKNEANGETFVVTFKGNNEIEVSNNQEDTLDFNYEINTNKMTIMEESKEVVFEWEVSFKENSMIVESDGDQLIFYKL